jgi:hypothetical protein
MAGGAESRMICGASVRIQGAVKARGGMKDCVFCEDDRLCQSPAPNNALQLTASSLRCTPVSGRSSCSALGDDVGSVIRRLIYTRTGGNELFTSTLDPQSGLCPSVCV